MGQSLHDYLLDMMGARPGERLAVVADADRGPMTTALAGLARDRGLDVDVDVTVQDYRRKADVLEIVLDAVEAADVALLLVRYDRVQFGGHSDLRKRPTARGARVDL